MSVEALGQILRFQGSGSQYKAVKSACILEMKRLQPDSRLPVSASRSSKELIFS